MFQGVTSSSHVTPLFHAQVQTPGTRDIPILMFRPLPRHISWVSPEGEDDLRTFMNAMTAGGGGGS
jgi:hypothetical protein